MQAQAPQKKSIFELSDCFVNKVESAPEEDLELYLMYLAHNFLSVLYRWGRTREEHDYVVQRLNVLIQEMDDTSTEQHVN